ncbi:MAG: GIY-YIG nuclease family protein [Candidatus Diapherotrites archaeon]|uniref:GIY-YIG nuclease family protein n=1 Tax=Candidatus Iainarchaeum sp. TaxID=3101447 RepID=A0A8T3YHP7_9ARCH|nr:GIY-YIG nuclease family protein [Candidatus Diapherotrites archaeon]
MPYFVYLLECADGSYYCGYTSDIGKRIAAHNAGTGARYTRSRRPVKLVYCEGIRTRKAAMKREIEVKTFTKLEKRVLVRGWHGKEKQ